MRSSLLNLVFTFTLILTTVGCGIKLGEKNKEQQVAEVAGVSCLTPATENLNKYFKGDATDQELGEALACVQKVLISFKDNIRGKDKNYYTGPELGKFLTKNLLKDKSQISDSFMVEFFKFKAILLGGSADKLTLSEVEGLSSLVAIIQPELIRINPYMKIIFSKWDISKLSAADQVKEFNAAQAALKKSLSRIAGFIGRSERSYELSDLFSFIEEALKLAQVEPATLADLQKARPAFAEFKTLFIGDGLQLRGDEWSRLGSAGAVIFFQKLRLEYFYEPLKIEDKEGRFKVYEGIAFDATSLLSELLTGKGTAQVSNEQIHSLLEKVKAFKPHVDIPLELLNQVGKIKLIIVGESKAGFKAWSVNDFDKLNIKIKPLFTFIRTAIVSLDQYNVQESAYRKNLIKYEDFNQAELKLVAAIDLFSNEILHPYSLIDAKALVINLKLLLKENLKLPENLDELFNLVYSVKVALTGDDGPAMSIANIQLLLRVGARLYGHYVEYANFVTPFSMSDKEYTVNLDPVVTKLGQSLALELKLKNSHLITSDEIAGVIVIAQESDLLKTKIKKESLILLLDTIWSNILNTPEKRLAGQTTLPGFNAEALTNLVKELRYWFDNQKVLISIFDKKSEYSKEELLTELNVRLQNTRDPVSNAALAELQRVLAAPGLMNFNKYGFLKILTPENGKYHLIDMGNSNFAKTFSRIFLRSYINDLVRFQALSGISLEETQLGFDKIKFVLYDLDLISRDNPNFISGRFLEANIFLSVSDGNTQVSFEEFHHLILHILSGRLRANAIDLLAQQKCLKIKNEIVSMSEYDEECLLNVYLTENSPFLDLPEYLKLKTATDANGQPVYTPEQNKKYYLSLLKAAGHKPNGQNTVLAKDASLYPHVVQYVEMVYDRHDANKNSFLDADEVSTAATTVFSDLIFSVVKKKFKKPEYPGILNYLLRCQKLPTSEVSQFKLLGFVRIPSCKAEQWPKIKSNRASIGLLIEAVSEINRAKPDPEVQTPMVAKTSISDDFICNDEQKWQCLDQFMYDMDQYCQSGAAVKSEEPVPPRPECPPPEEPEEQQGQ